MIVLDTSAIVGIIAAEPDAEAIARCLMLTEATMMSTRTALELSIVAQRKLEPDGMDRWARLRDELRTMLSPFDERQLQIAQDAYGTYGRGSGHPAHLNYGDCFSYALAKSLDLPLLFKGQDFIHTDIRSALVA